MQHHLCTSGLQRDAVCSMMRWSVTLRSLGGALAEPASKKPRLDEDLMPCEPACKDVVDRRIFAKFIMGNLHDKKVLRVPVGTGGVPRANRVIVTIHEPLSGFAEHVVVFSRPLRLP